jgi:hypothetical protein
MLRLMSEDPLLFAELLGMEEPLSVFDNSKSRQLGPGIGASGTPSPLCVTSNN